MSDPRKLSRRHFLRGGAIAAGAAVLGGSLLRYEDVARAQAAPDHFFLFIELKGGVCWPFATDARDLAELPVSDPKIVRTVELREDGETPPLTSEQRAAVLEGPGAGVTNGNVIILPYVGTLADTYRKGTTNLGATWRLGVAGGPLAPHVDDLAVVRGVRSIHNFHGGANDEAFAGIFSDRSDQPKKHVAGTLAAHLAREKGSMLLDNVVFEGASFAGTPGQDFLQPMRIDVRSLSVLASGQTGAAGGNNGSPEQRFARARRLAEAMGRSRQLGPEHKKAFDAYLAALGNAPQVQKRLAEIAGRLSSADASLDLDLQVDTALTLFESGLTRVATLCLGASNGTNNVDGFGLFDAHYGLLHKGPDGAFARRTYNHWLNVKNAMASLARLIGLLKTRTRGGRSLWDQTTVVVTSEFSRPSNAAGNEDNNGSFGAGHYNYNNNVILFGKGVRGGAWIGQNDPVTQYAHLVEMASLEQADPRAVRYKVPDFFTLDAATNAYALPSDGSVEGLPVEGAIDWVGGAARPIMPKDVMRTVYEIAGARDAFRSSYGGSWFSDARALGPVVA